MLDNNSDNLLLSTIVDESPRGTLLQFSRALSVRWLARTCIYTLCRLVQAYTFGVHAGPRGAEQDGRFMSSTVRGLLSGLARHSLGAAARSYVLL